MGDDLRIKFSQNSIIVSWADVVPYINKFVNKSLLRSSLKYPVQLMFLSFTSSSVSHSERLHSLAAFPTESLCKAIFSKAFFIFHSLIGIVDAICIQFTMISTLLCKPFGFVAENK